MLTPATLVGKTLGGFLIQGQLGSGGMGIVYKAHDDRLNRTVAIKVLHPKFMADDTVRQRFIREGRTAALIDHPNVVRVLAAGEEGGIPYLVTEFVDGGTLDDLLDGDATLSSARCLRIGKQLAEALAAAHRVGVMHRDVKPANVLFTSAGEPKLADFGLAREETADRALSQTGMVLGTPHYMSPEACQGRDVDARSDIYSLGVVLYAMLEKRLPFPGDSQARILVAQIQDPVPPLTMAPPALKKVVCRALEKNPTDRWASASELATALERALEEIYFPATPGGGSSVGGATTHRHPANTPPVGAFGADAGGGISTLAGRHLSGRRRGLLVAGSAVVLLLVAGLLAQSLRGRKGTPPIPTVATASVPPSPPPVPAPISAVALVPPTLTAPPPSPEREIPLLPEPIVVPEKRPVSPGGLEALRTGFARRDPASMQAELDAAGAGESADDLARIESAGNAVRRHARLLSRAFAWYRLHIGTVLDVQRTDGSAVHGVLQAADEIARRVYLESSGGLLNLPAADLSSRELVARALEDNPDNEVLLAALDLLLLTGAPTEAWPVALRVRRRGLAIEPDREALLLAQIPPADLAAAHAASGELESLRGDPARLRVASRDWLRKYRNWPLDPADSARARDAMRLGGGVASAEDADLCCAARVTGRGKSFSLDYGAPEAFLADFECSGLFSVEPGELAAVRPAAIPGVQLLKGLAWKEGVIEMQLRTASTFTVFVGWRSRGERFEFVISPARDGRISISLPIRGMSFDSAALAEGWIDLRFAWAPGKIVVRVNGTTRECPLPRDWSGEIGFAPGGPWSWRSLQVYGQADFEPPAKAVEFVAAPQARRALKASWGTWASPKSTQNELSIGSGEEVVWAAPATWEAGNDYRVAFGMHILPGATVLFDIGVGDGHPRVVVGADGGSGFVLGGDLFRSGPATADPGAGNVAVEIVVHRGNAWILMDGKRVWTGQLRASNRGGLTVGASGGLVTFQDLKVSELEP